MIFSLTVLSLSIVYLLFLNIIQIKNQFCLDKVSNSEKHKFLLELNDKTPLSGSFFFLPIVIFISYQLSIFFSLACVLFFLIGLLSDLKITNSPKIRLLAQFFVVIIFLLLNKNLQIDTRIEFLNLLMNSEIFRVLITSFFIVVLINGYNFIDGVNNLCSVNFLIVSFFLYFLAVDQSILNFASFLNIIIISLFIFVIFNFFGKNFLGDGGVYLLSFFLSIIIIYISMFSEQISPYYIANLLWYPAFENLFSIFRRTIYKKKNYKADNDHLHQLIFKYFKRKNYIKKKYLLSSLIGIAINTYLLLFYIAGFVNYSDTKLQLILIFSNTLIYIIVYLILKKKNL